MNEALEKLRGIGAQKIYEQTHIPIGHIQAILHESYDGLNKVQFLGFVSILEREYELDLDSVKLKGISHFDADNEPEEDESIFIQPTPKKNYNALYIIIAVIVFLIFLFTFYSDSQESEKPQNQESAVITKAKEKVVEEVNNTEVNETNATEVIEQKEEPQKAEPKAVEKSFVIKTDKRLWIGYIELATNKKEQTIFSKEFSLDPDTDWLLTLGHGYVDFEVNGQEYSYKTQKGLKFLYKDGELQKITLKEFKRYNRGYVW
ncbi:MAG: hypothetical protein ABXS93_03770 [Sulfurimonas sp.]